MILYVILIIIDAGIYRPNSFLGHKASFLQLIHRSLLRCQLGLTRQDFDGRGELLVGDWGWCAGRTIPGRQARAADGSRSSTGHSGLGLEKKLELDELAQARSSSARFGPARRSERVRAEPVFLAREKSEPARLGSV
jgi:hypothetical protein